MADTLDSIPGADVLDLVLHHEITGDGKWFSITTYYALPASHGRSDA